MNERDIFIAALQKEHLAEQQAYVEEACRGDEALRQGVQALLEVHGRAGSFLAAPPAAKPAPTIDAAITDGPGTVIGPYKLLELIGEGGFGVVFMAEQQQPIRRRVALKVLKPGMDTKQVIARFEAERQALALMDHPHIAKVYDAGQTLSGRPYFVMELVRGIPITEFCDHNHLAPRERLELFVPVCQAVQHAHLKGIIHRDIKPSNVLVTLHDGTPVVKVIDFGIAKALGQQLTDKTLFTGFTQMIGTPLYMSPEQAVMSGLDVDTRSDLYSLGVLLYELLTGTTPMDGERLKQAAYDEIRRIIREEEPPKPSTRVSTPGQAAVTMSALRKSDPRRLSQLFRGELDWIVMKALEKDRTRRYETASAFAADVQRYLHDEPVEACPPTAGYRLRKFARKYRTALTTTAVFAILLVLSAVASGWQAVRATAAEREAAAQRDAAREAQKTTEEQRQLAVDKEAAARAEAAKARLTLGMLQEMLGTAGPDGAKGPDYTVRQLLDEFEAGLEGRLRDQPEVEADLRFTISRAYYRMNSKKSEEQSQRALQLRQKHFGPDHQLVAEPLSHLARILIDNGKAPEAEKLARQALAILRKDGERGETLAETLRTLAFALTVQMKAPQEAEKTFLEATSVAEYCSGGKATALLANIAHSYAFFLVQQGQPEKAEPIAIQAVAMHRQAQGDKHPDLSFGLVWLGDSYKEQHKYADAERAYREALLVRSRAFGAQRYGSWAGFALTKLVFVLDAQFKDEETEAVLRAWQSDPQKPNARSAGTDDILLGRGLACAMRGDYAEAEQHFRGALEVCRKTRGLLDFRIFSAQESLGEMLFLQGKTEEARAIMRGLLLPARLATLSADAHPSAPVIYAVALLIGGSGQSEELGTALTMAQRGMDRLKDAPVDARAIALVVLGVAHQRNGDRDRAVQLLGDARALARPTDLYVRRLAETFLVQCLTDKGDLAAVEMVLLDVVRQRQAALPKGHPEVAAVQVNLATFLTDRKRHGEAETPLLTAYESLQAHPQANSASLLRRQADVLTRLVQLYTHLGDTDKADVWRKKLEQAKKPSAQPLAEKP